MIEVDEPLAVSRETALRLIEAMANLLGVDVYGQTDPVQWSDVVVADILNSLADWCAQAQVQANPQEETGFNIEDWTRMPLDSVRYRSGMNGWVAAVDYEPESPGPAWSWCAYDPRRGNQVLDGGIASTREEAESLADTALRAAGVL